MTDDKENQVRKDLARRLHDAATALDNDGTFAVTLRMVERAFAIAAADAEPDVLEAAAKVIDPTGDAQEKGKLPDLGQYEGESLCRALEALIETGVVAFHVHPAWLPRWLALVDARNAGNVDPISERSRAVPVMSDCHSDIDLHVLLGVMHPWYGCEREHCKLCQYCRDQWTDRAVDLPIKIHSEGVLN